jgi:hypothetical protein
MPISIRYKNDATQECVLRPAPLVSISTVVNKVGDETIGVTYGITLTGSLLPDLGFPYARDVGGTFFKAWKDGVLDTLDTHGAATADFKGPYKSFDSTVSHVGVLGPLEQSIPNDSTLDAIFYKQKVLRALFALDGQRMEIIPIHGDAPAVICYPRVTAIDFAEGAYINRADYTITLEADTLISASPDGGERVQDAGNPLYKQGYGDLYESQIAALSGAYISSFTDGWTMEVDESRGETGGYPGLIPRSYRITHSMAATGRTHYEPNDAGAEVKKVSGWKNAKKYIFSNLVSRMQDPSASGIHSYPNEGVYPTLSNDQSGPHLSAPILPGQTQLGAGALALIGEYRGFNHVRTEEVDVAGGSYTLTDTWLLASGSAYEAYSMSISSSNDGPFVDVSIDGTVTGLTEQSPSGEFMGGVYPEDENSAYGNAIRKFHEISNSGKYGVACDIFKRANNSVAVPLNSQPKSISLGLNEFNGDITYALSFDNRPTNVISGVLSETISVEDTYPGDVFAVIPVLGRKTGPVLQYIGGRSEYKRSLSLELVMDYTDLGYGSDRTSLMLTKPSLVEPTKTQIKSLIKEMSPEQEPGVRKYFIDPPSESWSPKEGRYSFNISWTYELDR